MSEHLKTRKPFMLMKNVVYSTYQLRAHTSNNQTPPEDAFKIVILEVMSWLRERFRALDVPEEIKVPEPWEYKNFNTDQIRSFRIDSGYMLETCYLKEEGSWAMQLVEPDLGPNPGRETQMRPPAPGRLFFTNIGLAMKDNTVEVGINIQVSELENEEIPCEVFRIGVVKRLARNALIGLEQEKYRIIEKPYVLDSLGNISKLKSYIMSEERSLPILVCAEPSTNAVLTSEDSKGALRREDSYVSNLTVNSDISSKLAGCLQNYPLPVSVEELAEPIMGYGYVFLLPQNLYEDFVSGWDSGLEEGGIAIYYPPQFSGHREIYRYQDLCEKKDLLVRLFTSNIQEYLKRKAISYGDVQFLRELKQKELQIILSSEREKGEMQEVLLRELEDYQRLTDQKIAQERGEQKKENIELNRENRKLLDRLQELEEKIEKAKDSKTAIEELAEKVNLLREENEALRIQVRKLCAPTKPSQLAQWIEEQFSGRLIFHSKAVALIENTPAAEVDMKLLCDALEFLATEYRNELIGEITEEERNLLCSKRYGRPFTVTPIKGMSPQAYSAEYKIKYYENEKGKKYESVLDLHLKVGNDSENLLRIYFLYDKEKKLIVVGSLPKHLKTLAMG